MSAVRDTWDRRLDRARELAAQQGPMRPLLAFYGRLLREQKLIYDWLCGQPPSGSIGADAARLASRGTALLPPFEHVRIDACESCGRYAKTIDLGRLRLAVPLVDEVAAAPLDVWARQQGYEKIELNLVGL